MRIERVVAALLLLGLPVLSFAQDATAVPEPETLALLAGAAVAWAIVQWNKRK